MPSPKIAVHLITWGADDWQQGLVEARELGYSACETFTHTAMEYQDDPNQFVSLLDEHDMTLSALYAGAMEGDFCDPASRDRIVESNEAVAGFLAEIGTEHIVFGPGSRPDDGPTDHDLQIAAETIEAAAGRCVDLGVTPCVHPHMYTELQDRHEIDLIMDETNADVVYLCPDSAHLHKAGMNPATVIREYGQRVAYAHLKDVTPEDEAAQAEAFDMDRHDEALPIFCELGLGVVDFTTVMEAYEDIGYEGWLTVEIDQSTSTPKQSLEICRDFVETELDVPIQRATYR